MATIWDTIGDTIGDAIGDIVEDTVVDTIYREHYIKDTINRKLLGILLLTLYGKL